MTWQDFIFAVPWYTMGRCRAYYKYRQSNGLTGTPAQGTPNLRVRISPQITQISQIRRTEGGEHSSRPAGGGKSGQS